MEGSRGQICGCLPEDAAKGHKRGPQGLQGVYYRKNKQIPVTDPNNLLVFDEDDNPKTFQCDVREQGKKMNSSIGLLSMHPSAPLPTHGFQRSTRGSARS
ncbi:hypothetical protein Ct61P_01690 [Colletotrichum tofieldiae]|nr:hypothetical protein Ct61P_01690 [Colletotrichum tofieldiae]